MDRTWRAGGFVGSAAALLLTAALAVPKAQSSPAIPVVPGPLLFLCALAVPAFIGLLGASGDQPILLIAAGVLYLPLGVMAMSGVTLPYLVIALLLLTSARRRNDSAGSVRSGRLILFLILAVPVAVAAVRLFGVLSAVVLVATAGVLRLARSRDSDRDGAGGLPVAGVAAVAGAAIVVLVIASWAAMFMLTETVCWVASQNADGSVRYERSAPSNELSLADDQFEGGCESGAPTPLGTTVFAALSLGALGTAALATRR